MDRNRRRFIAGTALLGVGHAAGLGLAAEPAANAGRAAITKEEWDALRNKMGAGRFTCVRTPESTDGPFYYESSPARRNITEGRKGMRLRLGITVANATIVGAACAPLPGSVVDVWHSDADGMYSNVGGDLQTLDTVGQTFMRGHQVTDGEGYVEFDTVVPGWELVSVPPAPSVVLRATHIHVKVFQEHKVATTQLYFPDDLLDELYTSVDPYRTRRTRTVPGVERSFERIRNGEDSIFVADHSRPMEVRREGAGIFARATIGLVTVGSRGAPPLFR
jgi:protocatechuate 3,4-dioxygenase beta subunit